jgi:hypothetical protein
MTWSGDLAGLDRAAQRERSEWRLSIATYTGAEPGAGHEERFSL